MTNQHPFSGTNKNITMNLLSAEFVHRVLMIKIASVVQNHKREVCHFSCQQQNIWLQNQMDHIL